MNKVIRLELELEDGTLLQALEEDANAIWKWYEDAVVFKTIHGMSYKGPLLKVIPPHERTSLEPEQTGPQQSGSDPSPSDLQPGTVGD